MSDELKDFELQLNEEIGFDNTGGSQGRSSTPVTPFISTWISYSVLTGTSSYVPNTTEFDCY